MNGFAVNTARAALIWAALLLCGCSRLPVINESGMVLAQDTTATIESDETPRVMVTREF